MAITATYVQRGEVLNWTNGTGADIAALTVLAYGGGAGVAGCDIADGETGALYLTGVFTAEKQADTDTYAVGAPVYYDTSAAKLYTAYASGRVLVGFATEASASGDDDVTFLLVQNGTAQAVSAAGTAASAALTASEETAADTYSKVFTAESDPTTASAGKVGDLWVNTSDSGVFILKTVAGETYTWDEITFA